jgi:hypothetical protein
VRQLATAATTAAKAAADAAKDSVSKSAAQVQELLKAKQQLGLDLPQERQIKLVMYSGVPLADLEMVLPHQQVGGRLSRGWGLGARHLQGA